MTGNYFRFHSAIKKAYPDIKVISNCDGSSGYLDHPADMYDVHVRAFFKTFSMYVCLIVSIIAEWNYHFYIGLCLCR